MSEHQPLVSIFMPVYNQEHFIAEAVESAMNQTYSNVEIVIGDDCSTDRTWEIIDSYRRANSEKIIAFRNKENLGVSGNCNEVLSRCKGEFIIFHAGDDVLLPEKVEKQVSLMLSSTSCILCHHRVEVFDSASGFIIDSGKQASRDIRGLQGDARAVLENYVKRGAGIVGQSVMIRRASISKIGYRNDLLNSDFVFWVDVLANNLGNVLYIDEVLSRYRKHGNSITSQEGVLYMDMEKSLSLIASKYEFLARSAAKQKGRIRYQKAIYLIDQGEYRIARRLLLEHVSYGVHSWKWLLWWSYSWIRQLKGAS